MKSRNLWFILELIEKCTLFRFAGNYRDTAECL